MKFLIFVLTLTLTVFATDTYRWIDLVEGEEYIISQKVDFEQQDESVTIFPRDKFKLKSIEMLPMIKVIMFKFDIHNCKNTSIQSDMELVSIEQSDLDPVDIGLIYAKNCTLEIFLESRDFNSKSLFY